jgi:uncharacterized protein YjbI with pentapeptide repeats
MANPTQVKVLKHGLEAFRKWRWEHPHEQLDFREADLENVALKGAVLSGAWFNQANLRRADLSTANLQRADLSEANLREGNFHGANLSHAFLAGANASDANLHGVNAVQADFRGANLARSDLGAAHLAAAMWREANASEADLRGAHLEQANLSVVNLEQADLSGAILTQADLRGSDLTEAVLIGADLRAADLREADLTRAHLAAAHFTGTLLKDTEFQEAQIGWTSLGGVDLAGARSLETVVHHGPSTLGLDTLTRSRGKIPPLFLRGCGFALWQTWAAKLCDPDLTDEQFAKVQQKILQERVRGAFFVGGVFICHAPPNAEFVDKLRLRLQHEGLPVWLDCPGSSTGLGHKRPSRTMRFNDVLMPVLSEVSVASDWIAHELETALAKERQETHGVLFPVAVDDAWKRKLEQAEKQPEVWSTLQRQNRVLDLSTWATEAFETQFQQLLEALKLGCRPTSA